MDSNPKPWPQLPVWGMFFYQVSYLSAVIKTFTKWANVLRFDYQNVVFSKADE